MLHASLPNRPLLPGRRSFTRRVWSMWVAATLSGAASASAHIELTSPLARYEITGVDTGIKGCPCGLATGGGNSNRTCNVAMDGSDPNRNEQRVYTAPAGSKVVLEFKETIGHVGKYRVAFDLEGADFDDFNAQVLAEVDDPQGNTGNVGAGSAWAIEVTLPNTPCDKCTLQLTQVMDASVYGNENVDWSRLATLSTYYSCIDLKLTGETPAPGDTGETSDETHSPGSSDATSSAPEDTSAASFAPVDPSTTSSTSTASTTSASGTTAPQGSAMAGPNPLPTTSNPAPSPSPAASSAPAVGTQPPTSTGADATGAPASEDAGGCSVTHRAGSGRFWLASLLLCGLVLLRRRDPAFRALQP